MNTARATDPPIEGLPLFGWLAAQAELKSSAERARQLGLRVTVSTLKAPARKTSLAPFAGFAARTEPEMTMIPGIIAFRKLFTERKTGECSWIGDEPTLSAICCGARRRRQELVPAPLCARGYQADSLTLHAQVCISTEPARRPGARCSGSRVPHSSESAMRPIYIYTGLETAPTTDRDIIARLISEIEAPANYRDPEKIAAYKTEKAASVVAATALDPLYGSICMVGMIAHYCGVAIDEGWPDIASHADAGWPDFASHADERAVIEEFFDFWRSIPDPKILVAHNGAKFDAPFIWKRALVLGIEGPTDFPRDVKPWDREALYDTAQAWNANGFVALDALSKAFGGPGKVDTGGKLCWELLAEGETGIAKAREYLRSDVTSLIHVHRKLAALDKPEAEERRRDQAARRAIRAEREAIAEVDTKKEVLQ